MVEFIKLRKSEERNAGVFLENCSTHNKDYEGLEVYLDTNCNEQIREYVTRKCNDGGDYFNSIYESRPDIAMHYLLETTTKFSSFTEMLKSHGFFDARGNDDREVKAGGIDDIDFDPVCVVSGQVTFSEDDNFIIEDRALSEKDVSMGSDTSKCKSIFHDKTLLTFGETSEKMESACNVDDTQLENSDIPNIDTTFSTDENIGTPFGTDDNIDQSKITNSENDKDGDGSMVVEANLESKLYNDTQVNCVEDINTIGNYDKDNIKCVTDDLYEEINIRLSNIELALGINNSSVLDNGEINNLCIYLERQDSIVLKHTLLDVLKEAYTKEELKTSTNLLVSILTKLKENGHLEV